MANLDTSIGPVFPTMAQIIAAFVSAINQNIDPSFAIEDDNLASEIVVILAEECSNMFDTLQNAYDVLDPSTADDLNLDDAAKYVGVTRTGALASKVFLLLSSATDGAIFPANTTLTAEDFSISNSSAVTISASAAAQATIKVLSANDGEHYTFELDDIEIDYVALDGDTPATVATALMDAVLTNTALFTASIDPDDDTTIIINKTTAGQVDYSNPFAIVVNTPAGLSLTSISAYAPLLNSVTGNITIPAGTFTLSNTPISGISTVQPADSINGAAAETDQDLRIKRDLSLSRGGNRTISAIESALLATLYVQKAIVYQNTANTSQILGDDITLLPHSIYAVILGGYKVDIANAIYNRMSEGIQTNGETAVALTDRFNNYILINFDYAEQIAVAINVAITVDKSVLYKINKNVISNIQAAILQYIQTLNIGENMYIASLASVAGAQVEYGIQDLSANYTLLPDPTIHVDDLDVEPNQIVVVNQANINVTVNAV